MYLYVCAFACVYSELCWSLYILFSLRCIIFFLNPLLSKNEGLKRQRFSIPPECQTITHVCMRAHTVLKYLLLFHSLPYYHHRNEITSYKEEHIRTCSSHFVELLKSLQRKLSLNKHTLYSLRKLAYKNCVMYFLLD